MCDCCFLSVAGAVRGEVSDRGLHSRYSGLDESSPWGGQPLPTSVQSASRRPETYAEDQHHYWPRCELLYAFPHVCACAQPVLSSAKPAVRRAVMHTEDQLHYWPRCESLCALLCAYACAYACGDLTC